MSPNAAERWAPPSRKDSSVELSSEQTRPLDLKLKRAEQELHLTWADGAAGVLDARTLRRNCPCATCREQREDSNPLRVLPVTSAEPVRMTGASLVGNYALKIVWSDGHDTGIFDFRYLRNLTDSADIKSPPRE